MIPAIASVLNKIIDTPMLSVVSGIREKPLWLSRINGGAMAQTTKTRIFEIPVEMTSADIPRGALNVEEFAVSQGLGRTITCRLVADGTVRSYKIGRRRLIPATETVDFPARMLACGEAQEKLERGTL